MHVETAAALLDVALEADDWLLTRMVVLLATTELDDWRGDATAPDGAVLDRWISLLRRIEARTKVEDFDAARATLVQFRAALAGGS